MPESRTSSSSAPTQGEVRHRVGWVAPGSVPSISIAVRNGPGIQNLDLLAIARTLKFLDTIILSIAFSTYKMIIDGIVIDESPMGQQEARKDMAVLRMIEQQFEEITLGIARFDDGYLKEQLFITYWQKSTTLALQVMPKEMIHAPDKQWVSEQIGLAEQRAAILADQLLHAASKGSLTPDILFMLGERWVRLDESLDCRAQKCGIQRNLESWDSLSRKIDNQMKARQPAPNVNSITRFWSLTAILWFTFLVTTIATIPLFALGYRFSEHRPGTYQDADFWFLLQSSLTQVLGIIMSFILIWKSNQVLKGLCISITVIALLVTILAVPLYTRAPTEWSSFLNIIGACIQAFMVLQIAILGG